MRVRVILSVIGLGFLTSAFELANGAPSDQLHTFYGVVKAVDLTGKTITLKANRKSFVFHVTNETKISGPNGYASLDKIQPGQGAAVVMRLGEGGIGIAVRIRFDPTTGLAN